MPPAAQPRILPAAVRAAAGSVIRTDQYIYNVQFLPLAANSSADDSFTVEQEADFDLEKLTYFATLADATQTESTRVIPIVTVTIATQDTRRLNFRAVPVPALFGIGMIPFILPRPKRLLARSQVTVSATNRTSGPGVAYNLWLLFIGTKLFRGS